jgi:prevent-host-death family protein
LTGETKNEHTMMPKPERMVSVAEFKTRLSEFLRAARRGRAVTVVDRDTPIARLVPYVPEGGSLLIRQPIRALQDVALPPPLGRRIDSLAALLEERQQSR